MKIYFVTTSPYKPVELRDFLKTAGGSAAASVEISVFSKELPELLDCHIDRIVTQKAIDAYQCLSLPCVVEHSGLLMDALPNLPGGLGQIIWKSIGDRMCGFLRETDSRAATARSVLGYCDGRHIRLFCGETRGRVAEQARGAYAFNWDPIFIPDGGDDRTYGEMGLEMKRLTSPVYKAWRKFLDEVVSTDHHLVSKS